MCHYNISGVLICLMLIINACAKLDDADVSLIDELQFTSPELRGDILFIGGYHGVTNKEGEVAIARQNHDFTGFLPIDGRSDSGYVIVNHEHIISDSLLGDGGGMTVFTTYKAKDGRWQVAEDENGKYRNVDFSDVGGTMANCGGFQTPWGTVLTAEEWVFNDNLSIHRAGSGITDTSDFHISVFNGDRTDTTIRRYQNFDWMVEVDVKHAKAIRKNYNMGRYAHEGGVILPDGKTIFLTDDSAPSFIYKFVADSQNDLSRGQLYVHRQHDDGVGGRWLPMPMNLNSMLNAPYVAAQLGATMYIRTEWAVHHDGKVYFTETGTDETGEALIRGKMAGAGLAAHLKALDAKDGIEDLKLNDYYGRILELNMTTGHVRVYLEGGQGKHHHFAQPDGLAYTEIDGHPVLMINEDLNSFSHGRVPAGYNRRINEIFCLDLSLNDPSVDDLKRLAIGPEGCETTGGRFTPDGSTYFVNIQHPSTENTFPYNNSVTVAVRNIDVWIRKNVLKK